MPRDRDQLVRTTGIVLIGGLTLLLFVAVILPSLGSWIGRGEFGRSHFDLARGDLVVNQARSLAKGQQVYSSKMALSGEFSDLSLGGEVQISADESDGFLSVQFWDRRGIQSIDAYVYLEGGRSIEAVYPDASSIRQIAPNWFFVENA